MRIGDIELTEPAIWNRETIADGNWLQQNTMKPLWDNEVALAEAIGKNREVLNLFLLSPSDSAAPEVDPPNDGWWICDKDKNVVTKEDLIEAHEKGYMLLLNESTDPDMNSRLYLPSETNITSNYVHVLFESVYYVNDSYIQVIQLEVFADGVGRLRSYNKVTRKVDGDRAKILKISYETSPYAVDEEKQLAYLIDTKTNEYVTAEDCKKWINEEKRPMYIFGVSNQDYVYHLSRFEDQGKSSGFQRYRMNFVCMATDYTTRRLVATFLSENINSEYATTKMRMYNLTGPAGHPYEHWCYPSYEIQDLALLNQVVRVDYDQSSQLTDTQKTTARNNIAASQVQYVRSRSGGQPTVRLGNLNIVDYEKGMFLNDGEGDIAAVAPVPDNSDVGNVLTYDDHGTVSWKPIPKENPVAEKFMNLQQHKLNNYSSNTSFIGNGYGYGEASIRLNEVDGRYPSKIIGSMTLSCNSNSTSEPSISICVTKSAHHVGDTNWDPEDDSHNVNHDILLGGDYYNNHITFMFNSSSCPTFKYTGIKYLSLKGRADCTYNVKSIQLMCFYEKLPERPVSQSSEND